MIYGYCRISKKTQSIERQERNIKEQYPDAAIIKEAFTGTKIYERKEFSKLLNTVKSGDKIVFDSVSRMSRTADDGVKLYNELFGKGIELVFLKEPYINTEAYRKALNSGIEKIGNVIADIYIEATNEVIQLLADNQIRIAFEQAEKEVTDLQERTKEGIKTAKINGKRIGTPKGSILTTKKSIEAKKAIQKHSKDFGGTLNDIECIKLCRINRKTFYKYKKELFESLNSYEK